MYLSYCTAHRQFDSSSDGVVLTVTGGCCWDLYCLLLYSSYCTACCQCDSSSDGAVLTVTGAHCWVYTVSYNTHHTTQCSVGVILHLTGVFSLLQVRIARFYTVSYCTHQYCTVCCQCDLTRLFSLLQVRIAGFYTV